MKEKGLSTKKIFLQTLEPLALGLLALLFIIPTLTVLNLKPSVKSKPEENVLGVTNEEEIKLSIVGGNHEIFTEEMLVKLNQSTYSYSTKLIRRLPEKYSKPILTLENKSGQKKVISFSGETLSNTETNVFLSINETTYLLQNDKGQVFPQKIQISPNENLIIFLSLESDTEILFSEIFDMIIRVN